MTEVGIHMTEDGDPTVPLSEYEGYDWNCLDGVPSADDLFSVLSHEERRRLLWFLLERPETTVEELADVLVGWRLRDDDFVGEGERRSVLVSLHHHHLPMLAKSGLVTYDADSGSVEFSPPPAPIQVLIKFSYQYDNAVDVPEA
ncbi:DNA-binding transcriptional regulator, ArsR family [Halogeometricum rufum]|uniref:DNA-binding transcriptional regulator, ArsR family n=2 Tax=Halogeometricum rufum TaxID=553469 RepID=A0A1I6I7H8_9EURY|nr:DNA-binding transcriptional regulator, ArsR family [Halogeometricum rufum]